MWKQTTLTTVFLLMVVSGFALAQKIVEVTGVAEVHKAGFWQPLSAGEELQQGISLRSFQGDIHVEVPGGLVRIWRDTEVLFSSRGFELQQGSAYAQGEDIRFYVNGPARVFGEARFDVLDDAGQRVVALSGTVRATFGGRVFNLEDRQQLIATPDGRISEGSYYERDPWYRDLVSLGQGSARVIGMQGIAEHASGDTWEAVVIGMSFGVGSALRTADASWLELRFDDENLLRLQEDTEIFIKELDDLSDGSRRTVIALRRGSVWAVVNNEEQPFDIETPGLVAGVRGTTFRLDASWGNTPPLLKTFAGSVAGIVGFETFEVGEGEQFDTLAGLSALVLDEQDQFNLERDRLLKAPRLELLLPALTDHKQLQISAETDAGILVVMGQKHLVDQSPVDFSVELRPGLNIIQIAAVIGEGGAESRLIQPVIRASYDLWLRATTEVAGNFIRLRGFTVPLAEVQVLTDATSRQLQADAQGRFSLLMSRTDEIEIIARIPAGFETSLVIYPEH